MDTLIITLILILAFISLISLISLWRRRGYRVDLNTGRVYGSQGVPWSAIAIGSLLLLTLIILIKSFIVIPPGYVGVQVMLGKVLNSVLEEGPHLVIPIVNVIPMEIRTRAYFMGETTGGPIQGINPDKPIEVLSSDGLTITLDVTVWYHLDPQKAPEVFQRVGLNYEYKIVRPAIREALRTAAVKYTATQLYSDKREEFVAIASKRIEESLKDKGIVFEKLLLRNVKLPPTVKKAIEEKIAALQEAQRMRYVLERERLEAKRKEVEAQGLANAQRIINQTLTDKYLQYLYLTTLKELANSQNTTFIITPFDTSLVPLMNITPSPQKGK